MSTEQLQKDKIHVTINNLETTPTPNLHDTRRYCDCCGKLVDHVNVMSSSLAAMSFVCCDDCAKTDLEPYGILVSFFAGTKWDDIFYFWQRIIKESCRLHGKTVEQFKQDCAAFMEDCKFWSNNLK